MPAKSCIEHLAAHPRYRLAVPGVSHLDEVTRLCRAASATGKLVIDAQHAALATADSSVRVTRDGDFARFERHGLRWQHLVLA
jgi:predicted nucleic acid-binding protein